MSSLDRILGNEKVKEYFKRAVGTGRISHSYMIEGEKGSGKKMLAKSFARILQCREEGDMDCGKCTSCLQIDHGNHPDVLSLVHKKENTITVDEVREQIINTADIIPYKGPYKIYIIDEAEKLGVEAQNALLKTIEEPPDYVILFLLVSNRGALLDTIVSRCLLLQTQPVDKDTIRTRVLGKSGQQISDFEVGFAAGYAMGNVGKALDAVSSEEFRECRRIAVRTLCRIPEAGLDELAGLAKEGYQEKQNISNLLDLFLIWYRDLLILKTTGEEDRLVFMGELADLQVQSDQLTPFSIHAAIQEIRKTRNRLRANVNGETSLLMLLIKLKQGFNK